MPPTPQAPRPSQQNAPAAGEYRYMSNTRAMELPIGDGLAWLEPGEIVSLASTDMNEKALRLIEDGILVDISTIKADEEVNPTAQAQATATDSTSEEKGGK